MAGNTEIKNKRNGDDFRFSGTRVSGRLKPKASRWPGIQTCGSWCTPLARTLGLARNMEPITSYLSRPLHDHFIYKIKSSFESVCFVKLIRSCGVIPF